MLGPDWGGAGRDVGVVARERGAPGALPVGVVWRSGLIVDARVAAGQPVVPIHPHEAEASRPRHRAFGAEDEHGHGCRLADLLRTDDHRCRALDPPTDAIRFRRALVRGRDDLVAARVQLANPSRSRLENIWPGAAAIFADVDGRIAPGPLERCRPRDGAARLGAGRLAGFLTPHRY